MANLTIIVLDVDGTFCGTISPPSTLALENLHSDYLFEIFKHLELADLANIAEANPVFQRSAEEVIKRVYKNSLVVARNPLEDEPMNFDPVLQKFGHLFKYVRLVCLIPILGCLLLEHNVRLLVQIAKYCIRIKHLKLFDSPLQLPCPADPNNLLIADMVSKLKVLYFSGGFLADCSMLFELSAKSLERLVIKNIELDDEIANSIAHHYPKLKSLNVKLGWPSYLFGEMHVEKLLETNGENLRKLCFHQPNLNQNLIQTICNLSNLTHLNVLMPKKQIQDFPFSKMPHLCILDLVGIKKRVSDIEKWLPANFFVHFYQSKCLISITFGVKANISNKFVKQLCKHNSLVYTGFKKNPECFRPFEIGWSTRNPDIELVDLSEYKNGIMNTL